MSPEDKAKVAFLSQALGEIPRPKVLVVEDNANDVALHLNILAKFECEVVVANNAEDAIQLIQEDGIDLILLDVRLPKNPADDVIAVAAGLMPDASVVMVTGYPDSAVKSVAIRSGAKLILKKPLTEETVSSILHRKLTPPNEPGPRQEDR